MKIEISKETLEIIDKVSSSKEAQEMMKKTDEQIKKIEEDNVKLFEEAAARVREQKDEI